MAKEANTANEDSKNLEQQIEDLRKEISGIAASLNTIGSRKFANARMGAERMFENVSNSGENLKHEVREKLQNAQDNISTCIRDKPLTSLAVAAGIGFVLAQLLRR